MAYHRWKTTELKQLRELAETYQTKEIAEKMGMTPGSVRHACKRYGISTRGRSKLDKHRATIEDMAGIYTGAEIARHLGVRHDTLRTHCSRRDIKIPRVVGNPGSRTNETTWRHGRYAK